STLQMAVNTLNFDILLALLFPIAIFLAALRANIPMSNFRDIFSRLRQRSSYGPFSLQKAYQSYSNYKKLASLEVDSRRATYNTLVRGHKRIGDIIGYSEKLSRLQVVTDINAVIAEGIAELAATEFGLSEAERAFAKTRPRSWFWARKIGLGDITARYEYPVIPRACAIKFLLGYDTTANELSFFMNLAFRFLLSPTTTRTVNEHTVRPYAHWFSHQRSNESLFRAISFPDAVPRLNPNFRLSETDFLSLNPPSDNIINPSTFVWSKSDNDFRKGGYDYVVTLFFIDTSLNVFTTMEHIYTLLRPGGTWINLGPLLWTSGGYAKVELSLDEVISAAEEIGFFVQDGASMDTGDVFARRTIECEYTGDMKAMMRWIYKAEFWVATRPK
ncbi:hypothetical protein H0H93_011516, partial [Arthromyces matolae]